MLSTINVMDEPREDEREEGLDGRVDADPFLLPAGVALESDVLPELELEPLDFDSTSSNAFSQC